jgi:NAD(P)-dependent dehydrogenase (short-subunit alcohol dehydrogenase family)
VKIENAIVLVTGGNRGLGKAFVTEALDRGARKVYAAARDPETVTIPGAEPVALDITDPESVLAAARAAEDVTLLVNNAAISVAADFLYSDVADVRREFETNFYGPLLVTRAFAPVIVANGGGHVLNVNSVAAWLGQGGSYSAGKAALWSMTNALRLNLAPREVGVTGLYVALIDTDMGSRYDGPKTSPQDVVRQALDGVEAGAFEVLADEYTRHVRSSLSADLTVLYPELAGS